MLTKDDYANILKLIDRALKSDAQPGGLADHMATAVLVTKIAKLAKAEPHGEDVPSGN